MGYAEEAAVLVSEGKAVVSAAVDPEDVPSEPHSPKRP